MNRRDGHEQLLVYVACQLRLCIQPLRPGLFQNGSARTRLGFVQRHNLVKVDLPIEIRLESRCQVVGVVVVLAVVVMMVMVMGTGHVYQVGRYVFSSSISFLF